MRRGTVLMAAAPTGWSSPGRVTRPTPGPPSMRMPGSRAQQTVAMMSRPSVASGSSPASLRTAQTARSPSMRQNAGATRTSQPLGVVRQSASGAVPVSRRAAAPCAASAAHVPVV